MFKRRFAVPALIVVASALLGPFAAFGADDAAPARLYAFKEEQSVTGTHIKRELFSWIAPFDKRYADLTPEQQQAVKADASVQRDGDEPPFPVNGLGQVSRSMAKLQSLIQVEGPLLLRVDVDAKGNADSVAIFKSPNTDMAQFTAKALMIEKYKPALCEGKPCARPFVFAVDFIRSVRTVTVH